MIWLIGSKGMLGTELSALLQKKGLPFCESDREVDIADKTALKNFTEKRHIKWIINCAAFTAVEKAEDDAEICRQLNTHGAANIAFCAKNINAKLIHISTDYVFNGNGNSPYTEEDVTDPIGIYGSTKRDGELAVLKNNPQSYIVRTAWLYGKSGNNFVQTMLKLMNEQDKIKVVNDQRGSPTWTFDLASAITALINAVENRKDIPFGIYHFTNEGNISWYDFAKEIYHTGYETGCIVNKCEITPCTSGEYPARVKRPKYSVLDKTKIKTALGISIPLWNESLKEFLKSYDKSN